ncbi:DegT/DnrJ/EryC1/StrS family aminotransferase [Emticicia sp.]|uniref:DegT/DnrJ/EryC1/StrS family aminotransferase n=1 Tax=Emticicia sp. TaxID=1930953 RepID=UPI00375325CD
MRKIQMVDLQSQYQKIKTDIDFAIQEIINDAVFIKGPKVAAFQQKLEEFLGVQNVITCGNGTDALQIAMMALDLKAGDEVIVPAFTYVATAEVIGLLGLTPVMIDVDPKTFNITGELVKQALSNKTKLIVPVHLFGQCTDMDDILEITKENNLFVIEDTAQAIGAIYTDKNGISRKAGTMGTIGSTSFFPSKNLGCYGDGGAVYTNDKALGQKLQMIANHGQPKQYTHDIIGINSRLDAIQAAVLLEKLKHLEEYNQQRLQVADFYDDIFKDLNALEIPFRNPNSTHVFHQYTLKVKNGKRDALKAFLAEKSVPAMIYYPKPLHHQKAYQNLGRRVGDLSISEQLCQEVLSLPIHTEMDEEQLNYITNVVLEFFHG